jgi:biotin carboxyl carrier protein
MNEEIINSQIKVDATTYETQLSKKYLMRKKYVPKDPLVLYTGIPGVVKSLSVKEGSAVKKGDAILVLEAMKMLNNIKSPVNGVVEKIFVLPGQQVAKDEHLVKFKLS